MPSRYHRALKTGASVPAFTCATCSRPALPYQLYDVCKQHPVCGECLTKSPDRCPSCDKPSGTLRIPHLDAAVEATVVTACDRCGEKPGSQGAKVVHVCAATSAEWYRQYPSLPREGAQGAFVAMMSDLLDQEASDAIIDAVLNFANTLGGGLAPEPSATQSAVPPDSAEAPRPSEPAPTNPWSQQRDAPPPPPPPRTDPAAPTATAGVRRYRLEGRDFTSEEVYHNSAFTKFINRDEPGRWCTDRSIHHLDHCPYLHELPKKVRIDGQMIDVSLLLRNRFIHWIAANPLLDGKWCTNPARDHDPGACSFAHRNPDVFLVEGQPVRESDLLRNQAWQFLSQNPQRSGRRCTNLMPHDVSSCTYVHFSNPRVAEELASRVSTQAHAPVSTAELNERRFLVDGREVSGTELEHNTAVYTMFRNNAPGKECNNRTPHDVGTCRFVHFKGQSRYGAPPPPFGSSAAPPPPPVYRPPAY